MEAAPTDPSVASGRNSSWLPGIYGSKVVTNRMNSCGLIYIVQHDVEMEDAIIAEVIVV